MAADGEQAIVVGSGPNGLAAAVELAGAGLRVTVLEAAAEIGGGTRSGELTLPGLLHDHCAAVLPLGPGSPFLRGLGLERYGVAWAHPEVDLAHPLDTGSAGALHRSLERTAAGLGVDGAAWHALFEPLGTGFDALAGDLLGPVLRLPRHPVRLAAFAARAVRTVPGLARRFRTPQARALLAGAAAHAFHPLEAPLSGASIGLMLIASAHRYGWPVARGGTRTVTDALAAVLRERGGTIETGIRVRSLAELPPAAVVMLDLAPRVALAVAGDRLPPRVRRAYARWRPGPGAFKVDLAVEGGLPWRDPVCAVAGTVHLGGTLEQVADAEREVHRGRLPERPFVLVGQQYLADPGRSRGDLHPVWAYAHVPAGYPGDATEAVLAQLERFAPGSRERIVAIRTRSTRELAAYNENFIGGDIIGGANTPWQLAIRPRLAPDPYWTGIPGVHLCSAATPPGAGVHGMCGHHAARAALRRLRRGERGGSGGQGERGAPGRH
ncbi:NAD(P)/FAD-dependent oxidoreductase [Kitasatospora sp. NBC_01287]|uniref:phytoene desaturase family protein n=1 Tax=Kitasatospora sp. NBC_01287 TaxID=2903573 RepID=UPI00225867CE|nr:NAD(P)/FAD-dependent oxidoreductase [Kitasatospora sp. NBC_01287]MCX4745130.1 NAD(P)/FAD-dependent oxidoreductase [Kitasatospora sp. NBC_01287]